MSSPDPVVAVDALRDLLAAGHSFRLATAEHFGVGHRGTDVLAALSAHGALTVSELARQLYLTPGCVTTLIDELEKVGVLVCDTQPGPAEHPTVVRLSELGSDYVAETRGWLALCMDLIPDTQRAIEIFAVLGYTIRSIRDEIRGGPGDPRRMDVRLHAGANDGAELQAALGRAALVLRLSRAISDETGTDAIAKTVAGYLREYFAARFVGIALVGDDETSMSFVNLDPFPAEMQERFAAFVRDDTFPVGAAARHRRAYFHASAADAEAEFPGIAGYLLAAEVRSMAHLPLVAGADVIGTLAVVWDHPRAVDIDDQGMLTVVAGYAAQALRRR